MNELQKEVESLRREIAPHLKFLKKQVEKVEKAEEMRRELVTVYKEYFLDEDRYIRSSKERLGRELVVPKRELIESEAELERFKKILTDSKGKDKKSDDIIAIENKLAASRSNKDAVTRELGRIEEIGRAHV